MALLILCLILPLVLVYLRRHPKKILYRGEALALTRIKFIDPRGKYAWIMVAIPNWGAVQAYIPVSRASALPDETQAIPVEVVVCRGTMGEPWVESMKWCDNEGEHRATLNIDDSSFLMGCYVVFSLVSALFGFLFPAALFLGLGLTVLFCTAFFRKPINDVDCHCHDHPDEHHADEHPSDEQK